MTEEEKILVSPEVCSTIDDEKRILHMEIPLPGVKKENIKLKMQDDGCSLSAPRKDIVYFSVLSFCCKVDPEKADAHYENGLLKLDVPLKHYSENVIRVPVL